MVGSKLEVRVTGGVVWALGYGVVCTCWGAPVWSNDDRAVDYSVL